MSDQQQTDHQRVRRELWAAIYRQAHEATVNASALRVEPEFRWAEAADRALTQFGKRFSTTGVMVLVDCGECRTQGCPAGKCRNAGVAPSDALSRNWWCPTCQGEVPPERVTYEETHDPRAGGCGSRVLARNAVVAPCGSYECKAGQRDGVLCADGECRDADGMKEDQRG